MQSKKTIGALLFEGFELLDVFGPLEAWGMLASAGRWKVVTTAAGTGSVASAQGPRAVADYALVECPKLDVILVPGGPGTRREVSHEALLARAGLLDGRRATTNKAVFGWVAEQGPAVQWIKEARWVEDGPFVTSSGVSAGIDMTLAVIARLVSKEVAEGIAVRMEYDWHRDASWDPFAKVHGLV